VTESISSQGDVLVLQTYTVVMVTQLCGYTKSQRTARFKWVDTRITAP
jgi:hypothetical protein